LANGARIQAKNEASGSFIKEISSSLLYRAIFCWRFRVLGMVVGRLVNENGCFDLEKIALDRWFVR